MGAKICQSPVQPARSRCGQSVGYVAGVGAEAPHRGFVELVQPFVAAAEPAGAAEIGVDDDSGHVVFGQRARMALDPHVLEAVRRVSRFERPSLTVGDDHVDLTGVQGLAGAPVVGCEVLHGDIAGRYRAIRRV